MTESADPVSAGVELAATVDAVDVCDERLRCAVLVKAGILTQEFGAEPGPSMDYESRAQDLEAELLIPLREDRRRLRSQVLALARSVSDSDGWPAGGSMYARAYALGKGLSSERAC